MMKIWNLTPHAVHYGDGTIRRTLPSDGVVRLEQFDAPAEPIDGLTTSYVSYGKLRGLPPEVADGDTVIVSTLVGDAWAPIDRPPRITVLVPDTGVSCRRDDQGRIVSVTRFIRK